MKDMYPESSMCDLLACLWILDMPTSAAKNADTLHSKIEAYDALFNAGFSVVYTENHTNTHLLVDQ